MSGGFGRIEYQDFQDLVDDREYRFRGFGPGGWTEFRVRIARAAFDDRGVRLQDGPDVCYRKLSELVAQGKTAGSATITIDDADFASYRAARAPAPKPRRSFSAPWPAPAPAAASVVPRRPQPTAPRRIRVEPPPVQSDSEPALEAGQRVKHVLFGDGVTGATAGGHTVVRFDEDGPRTFVTSLLMVDVLSAPHTWETGPRGNRPCAELLADAPTFLPAAQD